MNANVRSVLVTLGVVVAVALLALFAAAVGMLLISGIHNLVQQW